MSEADSAEKLLDVYKRQAERWVYCNPARRSPFNSSSRIGEPVRTALSSGRYFKVSGKLQQTFLAIGIQILLDVYKRQFHTPPQASVRVGGCVYESFVPGEDCHGVGLRAKIKSAEHTPDL